MTIKNIILQALRDHPKFRERSRKDRGFVTLIKQRYPNRLEGVDNETLINCMQMYASMDRAWRQALEENKELRGSDYGEKTRLEQEKQIDLGYEPGFYQNSKTLEGLAKE